MAEFIAVTLIDGSEEIINLDHVYAIIPVDEQSSKIVAPWTSHDYPLQLIVRGTPAQIAGAPRLSGPAG
jgi:hypothetical protein